MPYHTFYLEHFFLRFLEPGSLLDLVYLAECYYLNTFLLELLVYYKKFIKSLLGQFVHA